MNRVIWKMTDDSTSGEDEELRVQEERVNQMVQGRVNSSFNNSRIPENFRTKPLPLLQKKNSNIPIWNNYGGKPSSKSQKLRSLTINYGKRPKVDNTKDR